MNVAVRTEKLTKEFAQGRGVHGIDLEVGHGAIFGFLGPNGRGTSLGVASAVAAVSYIVSSMAPVVSWLKPVRPFSLFFWAVGDNQLRTGLSAGSWLVLGGVAMALALASLVAFQRLDIR